MGGKIRCTDLIVVLINWELTSIILTSIEDEWLEAMIYRFPHHTASNNKKKKSSTGHHVRRRRGGGSYCRHFSWCQHHIGLDGMAFGVIDPYINGYKS